MDIEGDGEGKKNEGEGLTRINSRGKVKKEPKVESRKERKENGRAKKIGK
jgi:hypothetical protein